MGGPGMGGPGMGGPGMKGHHPEEGMAEPDDDPTEQHAMTMGDLADDDLGGEF